MGSADQEKALQNRVKELNDTLKARDDEILQLGKKMMQIENKLDDATEGNARAVLALEEAEKQQLINEEEVSALQRRCSLLDTDLVTTENRLAVEAAKLTEAAAAAEAVEIQRRTLEAKSFVNDERIDSLDEKIITAQGIALISTRNAEEVARKLNMTQVELERTTEKANESEAKIQELEEQLNVVGGNMKTLELSETNALKRHEEYEEKIRDLTLNLKFTEIQLRLQNARPRSCRRNSTPSSRSSPNGRTSTRKSASSSNKPSTRWPDTKGEKEKKKTPCHFKSLTTNMSRYNVPPEYTLRCCFQK